MGIWPDDSVLYYMRQEECGGMSLLSLHAVGHASTRRGASWSPLMHELVAVLIMGLMHQLVAVQTLGGRTLKCDGVVAAQLMP